jgi:hypothetical protein
MDPLWQGGNKNGRNTRRANECCNGYDIGHFIRGNAFRLRYIYASSRDENAAQRIVDRAQATLSDFIREPENVRLRTNLDHAKGVLIFPEVLQGGLILGGSGGNGVILVRKPSPAHNQNPPAPLPADEPMA